MDFILGVTGASGAIYAQRLIEVVSSVDYVNVHLVGSTSGIMVTETELGDGAWDEMCEKSHAVYDNGDLAAPIASGSVDIDSMVILPCSMNTVGKINSSIADNLITRAASVTLKEGRKLLIVPRETPLSKVHLRVLHELAQGGATIMPASPGFYHKPDSIEEVADFIVQRVSDQLGLGVKVVKPWDKDQA